VVLPSPSLFKNLSSMVELFLSMALTDQLDRIKIHRVGDFTAELNLDACIADCKHQLRDVDDNASLHEVSSHNTDNVLIKAIK
jgi:hypothetical protein